MRPRFLAPLLLCAAAAARAGTLGGPGDTLRDVAYGALPLQTLDICRPAQAGPGLPSVILFHGGGWSGGDKSRFAAACAGFARAGIVAVSANYRLAAGTPGTVWPVQGQDAEAALAWVAGHAAALGANAGRICAMGASAGGQLALLAGQARAVAALRPGGIRAACTISLSGPTDLAALSASRRAMVRNLIGTAGASRALAASPIAYAGPGDAPVLLIHGLADPVVPVGQAIGFAEAASRQRDLVWLVTYPGGHVLAGSTPEQRRAIGQAEIAFIRTERLDRPPGRLDLP